MYQILVGRFFPWFHLTSALILRFQVPFQSTTMSQGERLLKLRFSPQKLGSPPWEVPYLGVYREGTEPDEAAGPRGPAPPGFPARPARGGLGGGGGAEEGAERQGEKGVGFCDRGGSVRKRKWRVRLAAAAGAAESGIKTKGLGGGGGKAVGRNVSGGGAVG